MFELQDTSIDYTQLTPLRALEQAGILNLPPPQRINVTSIPKIEEECLILNDIRNRSVNFPSYSQSMPHKDLAILHSTVDGKIHRDFLKSAHNQSGSDISPTVNVSTQGLSTQNINPANIESLLQQSYVVNNGLKEELNVIIEAPVPPPIGSTQEDFAEIHDASNENPPGVRAWGNADVEAIMNGKHIILVKKVLKPVYDEPKTGRVTCKICFNEFANKRVLMRHQVIHTGIKPHCCFTCFKDFNDISSLRKHLLIHKRSHRCPICLKMFLRRRQMELHIRQHNKKRFIQFGQKYHEVQVSTSRNERDQIVHEYCLSVLLNKTIEELGEHSIPRNKTSAKEDSFTSLALPNNDSDSNRKELQSTESRGDESQAGEDSQQKSDSQTSEKKVIYKCGHCKKIIYTRPTLSRHLMLHSNEKPFSCEKCEKTFRHKSDLVHHYKTHLKPAKCQTCGSAFSKRLYLKKHLEKGCPSLSEGNAKFTILPDLTYQCNTCEKILKVRANIFRHLKIHAFEERKFQETDSKKIAKTVQSIKGFNGGDDSCQMKSQNVEDFIAPLPNSVGFQCNICGEEFRFKSFILLHVRMHLNLRPFKCKECGREFFGRYLLRKHQQNHTRPYKCPKCGKGFNRRYQMANHFSRNHGEENEDKMRDITFLPEKKMLCCNICGKTMKSFQKSLMQYHIRLHKDVRPHQCKICQKSFISEIALKRHMLHHKKPYICQLCGKGFSRRYLMLEHYEKTCRLNLNNQKQQMEISNDSSSLQVNENEICSDSPFEAETITEIDEQTGLEIHKCVPCDKVFTLKDALVRHIKTFTKKTPCKYCKLIFSDKHLTLAHQRSCLGIEINQASHNQRDGSNVISHSQEKVLKTMEEINQKIDNYTSQEEEVIPQNEITSGQEDEAHGESIVCDDKEKHMIKSDKSQLDAIKKRTLSKLRKHDEYSCPECDRTFTTTRGLKIHATCHVRLFKCEDCGQDFPRIKALRDHLKSHLNKGKSDSGTKQDDTDNTEDKESGLQKELTIAHCREDENHSKNDDKQCKRIPQSKLKESEQKISQKKPKVISRPSGDGSTVLRISEKGQKDHLDLTARLMQSGTRGRPYSCKLCRRRFTEETGLCSHMSQIHGADCI